jgi:hypothetical protein
MTVLHGVLDWCTSHNGMVFDHSDGVPAFVIGWGICIHDREYLI